MAEKDLDEIREKLYDLEMPVEDQVWHDVQNSLRRRRLRKSFYYAMSSAAVVAVAFMLLVNPQRRIKEVELLAAAAVAAYEMALPQSAVMGTHTAPAAKEATAKPSVHQISLYTDIPHNEEQVGQPEPAPAKAVLEKKTVKTVAQVPVEEVEVVQQEQSETAVEELVQEKVESKEESRKGLVERIMERIEDDRVLFERRYRDYTRYSRNREFALAFNGGIMPGSFASVSGPSIMATSAELGSGQQSYLIEQVSDTKYSLPLNIGVQAQFQVGGNVAVGVGLNYTMLKSKYDCLVNKVRYNGKQTLHYIGVPVNVYGVIARNNNFIFYLNGGVMFEKGLKANYEFTSYKDTYKHSEDIDGVQFSFNAGMGVEYKVAQSVGLYFEPNIVYFTNSDVQHSIRTDQPLQIKGELGCRFHF